jgi:hypothetical protein
MLAVTVVLAGAADLAAKSGSAEFSWMTAEGVPERQLPDEAAAVGFGWAAGALVRRPQGSASSEWSVVVCDH